MIPWDMQTVMQGTQEPELRRPSGAIPENGATATLMPGRHAKGIVHIRAFGPLRGRLPTQVVVADGSLESLKKRLRAPDPELARWLDASVFIVDGAILDDVRLRAGTTVDILPPVSGG